MPGPPAAVSFLLRLYQISMNYQQTLNYLYTRLPMYQRQGASALKKKLDNIQALCRELGEPQQRFRSLHVAGTNGKGSCSHMLAAILQQAGFKTGLYTSPHLKDFTERVRVNGMAISPEAVTTFVQKVKPLIETLGPSFFEITVAMAFDYFATEAVDYAVVEVGVGGRLDSTNVIMPAVSLITNIGWDHMDMLGDTLPKIAFEKAGIIKPGVPVAVSERQPAVEAVFREQAAAKNAPLYFATDTWQACTVAHPFTIDLLKNGGSWLTNLSPDLKGAYQLQNIPGVMQALELLPADIREKITQGHIRQALENTCQLTGLKGRWQQLRQQPAVFCDVGHNAEGIKVLLQTIEQHPHRQLRLVWGTVKDKDQGKVLPLLPKNAEYYFCEAKMPRALPASELQQQAIAFGLTGRIVPDVNQALSTALADAAPDDLVVVGGSTFVVAELEGL